MCYQGSSVSLLYQTKNSLYRRHTQKEAASFECSLQVSTPKNDHYVAFNIRSSLMDFNGGSYTYVLDTMTNKVDFRQYKEYFSEGKFKWDCKQLTTSNLPYF